MSGWRLIPRCAPRRRPKTGSASSSLPPIDNFQGSFVTPAGESLDRILARQRCCCGTARAWLLQREEVLQDVFFCVETFSVAESQVRTEKKRAQLQHGGVKRQTSDHVAGHEVLAERIGGGPGGVSHRGVLFHLPPFHLAPRFFTRPVSQLREALPPKGPAKIFAFLAPLDSMESCGKTGALHSRHSAVQHETKWFCAPTSV